MTLPSLVELVEGQLEVASLSGEVEAVMRSIVERLMALPGADGASLSSVDDEFAYFHACLGLDSPLQGRTIALSDTLGNLCIESGAIEVLRAAEGEEVPSGLTDGAGTIVLAPIIYDGKTRGILGVRSANRDAFAESDVETISLLARSTAIALRNAELVDRLERSELEYRRLHDQASEGVLVSTNEGHMLDANEAAADLLWYSIEELRSMHAFDLFVAEERGAVQRDWEELQLRRELRGERMFRRKDGVEIPVEYAISVLDDGRLHAILHDATERRADEARLNDSIARLRAIVQTQQEISSLELDHNAVTAAIVERAQLLAGADGSSLHEFVGDESVIRFASGASTAHVGRRLNRAASLAGAAALLGEPIYSADTSIDPRVVPETLQTLGARSLICAPMKHMGQTTGVLAVMSEAPNAFDELAVETTRLMAEFVASVIRNSEELAARQALVESLQTQAQIVEESEGRFRGAFHSSAIGMAMSVVDGNFVQVNDRFAEMLSYTPEELTRIGPDTIVHPEDHAVNIVLNAELVRGERDFYAREMRMVRKDGAELWVKVNVSVVRDYEGRPMHYVAHIEDISERRGLEQQLRQAQKMEAIGRLAGGIAHDFNNLLTAVTGYSEFLISGIEDARLHRYAEEIKRAAGRAADLTGQLLAFSRRQVLQPRALNLNAVVSDMNMMLHRVIGEDIELVTQLEPDLGVVLADPTQIEQVIVNLAVNARDAMLDGGAFTIVTANVDEPDGELVELTLTDTGTGMSDEEQQRLFEPFFTTKDGGTGLGLATVYGIVEQSGGSIEVDSVPGLGSSFRIRLPRVHEEVEAATPSDNDTPARPGDETILLVEDEAVVRQLVAEILESNGYTVLQASDGPSALEVLRRHSGPVELLVTDVVMPGMSGREVAQAVTSMRPQTRVLYTSGYTDSAIGHHGVLEPGIAFLQKPFSAAELAHRVRGLLDTPPPA